MVDSNPKLSCNVSTPKLGHLHMQDCALKSFWKMKKKVKKIWFLIVPGAEVRASSLTKLKICSVSCFGCVIRLSGGKLARNECLSFGSQLLQAAWNLLGIGVTPGWETASWWSPRCWWSPRSPRCCWHQGGGPHQVTKLVLTKVTKDALPTLARSTDFWSNWDQMMKNF